MACGVNGKSNACFGSHINQNVIAEEQVGFSDLLRKAEKFLKQFYDDKTRYKIVYCIHY